MNTDNLNQNLGNLMKEAQKMQQRMQELQEEIGKLTVEGESGGGMVKLTMNGRHDVSNVRIHPSIMDDKEMVEDLLAAAVNDAVRKIEKISKDKIAELTAGLNLPKQFTDKEDEG